MPKPGSRPSENRQIARFADGRPIYLYDDVPPTTGIEGEVELLPMYAGQSVGMVTKIMPAAEIVREIVRELTNRASRTIQSLAGVSTETEVEDNNFGIAGG